MKKPIWSNKEMADIAAGMGNAFLVLAGLILMLYFIAPLFGGKFQPRALLGYGCWIGMALIMKYLSKYYRDKIRMKKWKWYFISILMIMFLLVWFPSYIGLVMSALIVFGYIATYRVQGKTGWQDEL